MLATQSVLVQQEISKFRDTRETFTINDKNWLWLVNIMIVWIRHNEIKDDIVKIIDMWELDESFDVMDYKISLTDLIIARQMFLDIK